MKKCFKVIWSNLWHSLRRHALPEGLNLKVKSRKREKGNKGRIESEKETKIMQGVPPCEYSFSIISKIRIRIRYQDQKCRNNVKVIVPVTMTRGKRESRDSEFTSTWCQDSSVAQTSVRTWAKEIKGYLKFSLSSRSKMK